MDLEDQILVQDQHETSHDQEMAAMKNEIAATIQSEGPGISIGGWEFGKKSRYGKSDFRGGRQESKS